MGERKIKKYLTAKEVCERGIFPFSLKTLTRRIEAGEIVAIKEKKGYIIDLDDIEKYMEERKTSNG